MSDQTGYIELHILHSFPPSNVNRDDLNQPKDGYFGGRRRARVSSQCFKRAIRINPIFTTTTQVENGDRTRLIVRELRDRLKAAGKPEEDALAVATEFARVYSSKKGKMDKENPLRTKVLLYLSPDEQNEITQMLLNEENWTATLAAAHAPKKSGGKKKGEEGEEGEEKEAEVKSPLKSIVDTWAKKTKERTSAPDIALFGRMLADKPITNIDAACQVAHAFSTHEVRKMDDDFFSAVEDLRRPEDGDEAGAAMIGNLYFTSACFYRYARLDWTQLKKNLGDDDLTRKTVRAFLLASEAATPTGMANSHDNNSRPAYMLAVARVERSASWSLANAFEKPIPPSNNGFIEPSIEQLDKCWSGYRQFYGGDTVKAFAVAMHPALSANLSDDTRAALKPSLAEWVDAIMEALPPKE